MGQDVGVCFGRKSHGQLEVFIVLGHTHIAGQIDFALTGEAVKLLRGKRTRNLTCPVRTKIEKNQAVAITDRFAAVNQAGNDKLIADIVGVGGFNGGGAGRVRFPLAVDHGPIGLFDTFPALVTVHGVEPAGNGGNGARAELLQLFFELLQVGCTAAWRGVAAIHKGVDINLFKAVVSGHFD